MKTKQQLLSRRLVGLALGAAFAIVLSGYFQSAMAQTNTFPPTGNAGVGTTSPGKLLTVNGDAAITTLYGNSTSQNANDSLKLGPGSNGNFFIDNTGAGGFAQTILGFNTTKTAGGNGVFSVFNNSTDRTLLFFAQSAGTSSGSNQVTFPTGNVGIGTTAPIAPLHIGANYDPTVFNQHFGALLMPNLAGGGGGSSGYGAYDRALQIIPTQTAAANGNSVVLYMYPTIATGVTQTNQYGLYVDNALGSGTVTNYYPGVFMGGNVGIGTSSPGYKLDVAGVVRSTGGFRFNDNTVQTTAATMTGVTAGAGLTGGGTSGSVTLTNDDRGSSQNIFKNIANASGTTQFSAGSNSDGIRFAGSNGTSVTFDATTKKVIIDGSTSTPSAGNISAGQFGQNTGGGNYTFPGNVTVNGNIAAKYQDLAEWVPSSEQLPTGTVVVLDSTKSNQVISSSQAYDTRVAGVISEQPGIALGERGSNKVLVATTGRVRVKVDATHAPIQVGDLLVSSDVPGMAMKSEPVNIGGIQLHRPGTLIGKALEPLTKGQGAILVLLSLQ